MKFRIEQNELTDAEGHVVSGKSEVFLVDAETADKALHEFLTIGPSEILGKILKLPGLQIVATARQSQRVFTLQVAPASDRIEIKPPQSF